MLSKSPIELRFYGDAVAQAVLKTNGYPFEY